MALKAIHTDEDKSTPAPKATIEFQASGCEFESLGWRDWMGHQHEVSFRQKDQKQINAENLQGRTAKATEGQKDLEEQTGSPEDDGEGESTEEE